MSVAIISKLVDKCGMSKREAEMLWKRAILRAQVFGKEESDKDFYLYVIGILKKTLSQKDRDKLKESNMP